MNARAAMALPKLLSAVGLQARGPLPDAPVRGIAMDSRNLRSGDIFLAVRGAAGHGLDHLPDAFAAGASAVLFEQATPPPGAHAVPLIEVPGLQAKIGSLAAELYQQPSAHLQVLGVTGTNGKTSSVHFLAQALTSLGHRVGTQGTLGSGLHGQLHLAERTTPDATQTQRWLAQMVEAGADCVAMEVSSHALNQGRVDATRFKLALFTNLSRDHLDYHRDMEDYFQAKCKLFRWPELGCAVVNIDDPWGRRLASEHPGRANAAPLIGFGESADADLRAVDTHFDSAGMRFTLDWKGQQRTLQLPLLGRFNLANALGVAAALLGLGHDLDVVARGLAALRPVPGRMQWLDGGGCGAVVVDYAHTPDALSQALSSLRAHCTGKLRVVFGCGGDRDPGKRPAMGEIAERMADAVIVTDDNPRSESPAAIAAQILVGCVHPQSIIVEHDRGTAIGLGLSAGVHGDILLIAGKGHEQTQESAGKRRHFDDAQSAREWLEQHSC